ncbi:carotenoid biosynthesis protein [Hufsiella ginkgonis]|uniref:Carotenoid biosynthesis protein n=1 Tax=Hufsiella ginkgonis TaxID=2695274 RepID=A0A7K1XWI4_9SPHI|nr:carotenoid biosynthesis protein [Hufsiella ginkgonis]MXV15362.1 carotenoid biosynthesis protein [Hufsiella ginkgonis]
MDLPYAGIPYGPAPAWCFPLFECGLYLLFILCLVHAAGRGARNVLYILGGLAFGLLLEYMEVLMESYTYGRFWVMLGKAPMDIPLCIGVGWGIIMYTARLFTDRFGLGLLAAAALDTLLALNIDLGMDTVAYRTHMWHWNWVGTGLNPLTAQWFGIPYGNFIGWQTVVFCYSAFSRTFEKWLMRNKTGALKFTAIAVLALLSSLFVLYASEVYLFPFLNKYLGIKSVHRFYGISVILLGLVIVGWGKRKVAAENLPAITWMVPGWFHLFFTACFFILGFYKENTWMTAAACINLLIGVIIHLPGSFKSASQDSVSTAGKIHHTS